MRGGTYLVLLAALMLCGCAGYHLGPTNGQLASARSVQVTPFLNNSTEPGLADEVTSQLRKQVQRDGTLRLATEGDADLVLTGVIEQYQRRELSLQRDDVRTVRDYQISLSAHVKVIERGSGRTVLDQTVKGGTMLRVGSDLVSSERQATPLLAKDLAQKITDLLVDGGW